MSDEPVFRVVRGAPTFEELAAIVGVLWSRRQEAAAAATAAVAPARTRWRASAAPGHGGLPRPGRGAWASAR
jgi:hypothetical protein